MDDEAVRQEIQSYLHEYVHKTEIPKAEIVKYLQSLDPTIQEDTVTYLLKDMAGNDVFLLEQKDGEWFVKLPSLK